MLKKTKLIRITTVPISLRDLLKGQLNFLSQNGFEVVGVSSPGLELEEVREREGVPVIAVEMSRTISPIRDLMALWKLYKVFRKERPFIVHTHTPKAGTVGMLAAKLAKVPVRLHTVAGLPLLEATGIKRKLLNIVERITYSCAIKVYPNSMGLQKIILDNKFTSAEKLKVIGNGSSNGIDINEFNPETVSQRSKNFLRSELGIKPDDLVFLFVGRVVTDKGLNELVEAFYEISSSYTNCRLLIVGNRENSLDPLAVKTDKLIQESSSIHMIGYKRNVVNYFAISDVFVFPSYREGFPNVVMQAAAMKLNAIVTNINGCNEMIQNGENGWVVPVKDANLLRDKMRWCVENREASRIMGEKSRKLMQEKFERKFVHGEILREYYSFL